jgi:hypothetical protein
MTDPEHTPVILLGDHQTARWPDRLAETAAEHCATIVQYQTFEPDEVSSQDDLADTSAVVIALALAISLRIDIWVPFPMQDLGREQHVRRLSLVLQRHGVNLRLGQQLAPCPSSGGMNEVDFALRSEVHAVDGLDHAALAVAGICTLEAEIEATLAAQPLRSLTTSLTAPDTDWPGVVLSQLEREHGRAPAVPPPTAPWAYRLPVLKEFAIWLVNRCGTTQAFAARILNALGHRTPGRCDWRQATVSALVNGRYDRGMAA